MVQTKAQYDAVIASAREIFLKKTHDYGTSWRALRPISVVDQIYIKAWRIRMIQQQGNQKISDDINSEWKGILNYAVIGLMQLQLTDDDPEEMPEAWVSAQYAAKVNEARSLMELKNHDYGEAWRQMSAESFADLILMKLYRMKQIIRNDGKTLISEGLDANYHDILNYAVFALIVAEG